MKCHVSDETTRLGVFLRDRSCSAGATGEGFMGEGEFTVGTENQEFVSKQVAIVKGKEVTVVGS